MRPLIKVLRDLWLTRGRVGFMVLALAAGLISIGSVLSMRSVLQREMARNYLDTVPASMTIDVGEGGIDDRALEALRERPEVAWAERRASLGARWRHPGAEGWGRALLFVIEDFDDQRLALLELEQGQRVPPTGGVLVERGAMAVLDAELGEQLEMTTSAGEIIMVEIVGVVHEPALAPAGSEQAGYFYATPETLALFGAPPILDELRVLVAEDPLSLAAVEAQAEAITSWLLAEGVEVHELSIPPPGRHPHQGPSDTVLVLFAVFGGLTVVLASVLSASLLSITMARQVREVAVMKTLGATRSRIRRMYIVMLGIIAVAALVVSALPTWALGRLGVDAVASLLNFDIASYAVPPWVIGLQILIGLSLPVLTAAPAIIGASRVTIREALDEHGAAEPTGGLERGLGSLKNRLVQAALLNALRVRRRLLLTLGLLALGGGLFITAVSVADSWDAMTDQVLETRHYELELRLGEAATPAILEGLEGATVKAETWGVAPLTLRPESGLPLSRTYPDGGHGSFSLVAAPDDTQLVDFELRAGRWLLPGESEGVVLNQLAAARVSSQTGADPVGQRVELVVEGRGAMWSVVGVVEEVAAPATAYVSTAAFVARTGQELRMLRVDLGDARDPEATQAEISAIEAALGDQGVKIVAAIPLQLLYNAMGEHVLVLIRSLLSLALMMAIVGVLALGASMSTSVVERTRELGVLQAIGARPVQIRSMILIEGWFVTTLSLPLALLVALPLTAVVARMVGQLSFQLPLPLDISWLAVTGWSLGVLAVSTVASWVPARAATRLTVREALSHV